MKMKQIRIILLYAYLINKIWSKWRCSFGKEHFPNFFFFYLALMLNKKEIETIIIHQDKLKKIIETIKKKLIIILLNTAINFLGNLIE